MAWVEIIKEVKLDEPGDWQLCFQWCEYHYDDTKETELGYRFIWRRPNGNLQAARGQARIPSWNDMNKLFELARKQGWLESIEKKLSRILTKGGVNANPSKKLIYQKE